MDPAGSPVYAFLRRPSLVDYPGRLAAVFFLDGCNFRCGFCHNAPLMREQGRRVAWAQLDQACRRFHDNWVDAAVITGGEPTRNLDLSKLVRFLKGFGWAVKLDTNGSNPEALERCCAAVDYVAMDVKAGPLRYQELTGYGDVDALSRSIEAVRARARDYEFRTTIIEPFHTDAEMRDIGGMIRGCRRYMMQPFVPKPSMPDPSFHSLPRTSSARLLALRELMREYAEEVGFRGADPTPASADAPTVTCTTDSPDRASP
jgi:pyruvate formate lyase activating enzyme